VAPTEADRQEHPILSRVESQPVAALHVAMLSPATGSAPKLREAWLYEAVGLLVFGTNGSKLG
jgi:hypothetical protein